MTWLAGRQRRKRSLAEAIDRMIAETEAFLSGDYVDHLRRLDVTVPAWAQLNVFCSWGPRRRRTFRWQGSKGTADASEEAWRSTVRVLAGMLIDLVDGDRRMLHIVQRQILVPLEFELMDKDDLTPFELLRYMRTAFRSNIPQSENER
jgi:hypothetical protein